MFITVTPLPPPDTNACPPRPDVERVAAGGDHGRADAVQLRSPWHLGGAPRQRASGRPPAARRPAGLTAGQQGLATTAATATTTTTIPAAATPRGHGAGRPGPLGGGGPPGWRPGARPGGWAAALPARVTGGTSRAASAAGGRAGRPGAGRPRAAAAPAAGAPPGPRGLARRGVAVQGLPGPGTRPAGNRPAASRGAGSLRRETMRQRARRRGCSGGDPPEAGPAISVAPLPAAPPGRGGRAAAPRRRVAGRGTPAPAGVSAGPRRGVPGRSRRRIRGYRGPIRVASRGGGSGKIAARPRVGPGRSSPQARRSAAANSGQVA